MRKKIGLGTWSWGNQLLWSYQESTDNLLLQAYREALKRGYSLIDTADSYGTGRFNGRSEKLLGIFLSQTPESQKRKIQIATKLAPYPWRLGRKGFNKPYKNSLERLNNKLDIVQLHWSTAKYNPYQEFQLLNNLCDLNKKGHNFKIGLSNVGPIKLQEIINFLAERNKKVQSVQVQFSLLAPNIEKQQEVKEICDLNKIDFLAYSPLSFGLLCKSPYSKKVSKKSLLRNFIFNLYEKSTVELRHALFEIAKKRDVSQAQVAVNWCCYQGAVPIVGSRTKSQVEDIAGVLNWNLSKSEFQELDNLSKQCKRKFPNNPFASM